MDIYVCETFLLFWPLPEDVQLLSYFELMVMAMVMVLMVLMVMVMMRKVNVILLLMVPSFFGLLVTSLQNVVYSKLLFLL